MSDPDTIQILLSALTGTLKDLSSKFDQVLLIANHIEQQSRDSDAKIAEIQKQITKIDDLKTQIRDMQASVNGAITTINSSNTNILNDEFGLKRTSEKIDEVDNKIKPVSKLSRQIGKPLALAFLIVAIIGSVLGLREIWKEIKINTVIPTPSGLTVYYNQSRVLLSWSLDDHNLSYRIIRDGSVIASEKGAFYVDTSIASNRTYCYQIQAFDGSGKSSSASQPTCVKTE